MNVKILLLGSFIIYLSIYSLSAQTKERKKDVKQLFPFEKETDNHDYMPYDVVNRVFTTPYRKFKRDIFTTQVNVAENGQNILGDAANEPSIAVNPLNPDEIVIGWRQFNSVNSDFREAGYAYSTDGGQSWTMGVIETGVFRSDPVLGCDANGKFYYTSLRRTESGFSFQSTLFQSTTPGVWDGGTFANGGDKHWMVIDPMERDNPNIYSYWGGSSICQNKKFTRSIDGGKTFEPCTNIPYPAMRFGTMDIGPNGEVYICGTYMTNFIVSKSINAWNKQEVVTWDLTREIDFGGGPAKYNDLNPQGLSGHAEIAVDRSTHATKGNVYVLSTRVKHHYLDPPDIMFSKSTDGGENWSAPMTINTDGGFNYQWFGTLSVAPNGRVDIIWLDTRDHPYTFLSSLYYAYSLDGGESFSGNKRLSDAFDPHVGWPVQKKMGDYIDMVSDNQGAHVAWTATFNGEQDVYYSYIQTSSSKFSASSPKHDLTIDISQNSFAEQLTIQTFTLEEKNIEIYDALGKKVYANTFQQALTIETKHWDKGVYAIKVISKGSRATYQEYFEKIRL